MVDSGVEARLGILRNSAIQQILKPLQTHQWKAEIVREVAVGDYLIISAEKAGTSKRIALLYSSATDNRHYRALDAEVDLILTNGSLYKVESFAYGITTPVAPIDEFFPILVGWNKELAPAVAPLQTVKDNRQLLVITAENPLDGVWARINQFASFTISRKLILRRSEIAGIQLSPQILASKAEGVAYSVQNASDYLRSASSERLNKRILSLYYGTLALSFAEMLAAPWGPSDLDEVEGFTKFGHGLYTVPGEGDLGTIYIGTLASGLFPRWMSFLGHDVTHFPKSKAKSVGDIEKLPANSFTTLRDLFSSLPELGDLFLKVFDVAPSWVMPIYDSNANPSPSRIRVKEHPGVGSTYVHLVDTSGRVSLGQVKGAPWPLAEVDIAERVSGKAIYRARVDHPGFEYWHQALPIHHSPFIQNGALILPSFGVVSEYRALSLVLLYALSIVVRYMPSAWRRVVGGDWDQYLTIVETTVSVLERLLPEEFLESISGERVQTRQPGSLF